MHLRLIQITRTETETDATLLDQGKMIVAPTALETAGGIVQALPLLGDAPFFAVNAKIIWLNGKVDALTEDALATVDDARR